MTLTQLQEQYQKLLHDAEGVRAPYAGKPDTMTAEEGARFDKLMEDADLTFDEIQRLHKLAKHRAQLDEPDPDDVLPHASQRDGDDPETTKLAKEHQLAFARYLIAGERGLSGKQLQMFREAQADSDIEGGYLVAPEVWVNQLIKELDDLVVIRALATVITIDRADSLGVPTLDQDLDDAEWTAELGTGTDDQGIRIGKRSLHPHPLAKQTKLSRTLIRRARMDVEGLVRQRLAYKFGITEEKAFATGTGDGQPLGVFVASNDGIPVGRDVLTGKANDISADGVIDIVHALKPFYWSRARWLISRDYLKRVRKLKDGDGTYIWQQGLNNNLPNRILEIPYVVSEYVPNTFTDGQYVAVLGDFSNYWIADALALTVQVLNELYATTNQIGYIARKETDGMPVLAEAFVRAKVGA